MAKFIKDNRIDAGKVVQKAKDVVGDASFAEHLDRTIEERIQQAPRNASRAAVVVDTVLQTLDAELTNDVYEHSGGASTTGYIPSDMQAKANRILWAVLDSGKPDVAQKQMQDMVATMLEKPVAIGKADEDRVSNAGRMRIGNYDVDPQGLVAKYERLLGLVYGDDTPAEIREKATSAQQNGRDTARELGLPGAEFMGHATDAGTMLWAVKTAEGEHGLDLGTEVVDWMAN